MANGTPTAADNDYFAVATTLLEAFQRADAQTLNDIFTRIAQGVSRLPREERLKRGLLGSGTDRSDDANTVSVVTGDVPIGTYRAGYQQLQRVQWIVTANNTGAVVINVDGGPGVPLVNAAGVSLAAGFLVTGAAITAVYSGAEFRVVEATATINSGAGVGFTEDQVIAIVRREIFGDQGAGVGPAVVVENERVASAADLAAVVTSRRVATARVTAAFTTAAGVSYKVDDLLLWENTPAPGAWQLIYTRPPTQVLPGEGAPLGTLAGPLADATFGKV